jgi:hypothetical protein
MAVNFTGSLAISGSLTATSTITAQTLVVQTITSSISSITGSTNFGTLAANTHTFTGSMSVSGSGTFTGALSGTSATFSNGITANGVGLNPSLKLTNTTATTGVDWHLYSLNNGNFGLYNNTAGSYALQIASTGAATFSSDLTINGEILTIGGTTYNAVINNIASVRINIDSANTRTGEVFQIGHNQTTINSSNVLFQVNDDGKVGIGTTSPDGTLTIKGANDANLLSLQNSGGGTSAKFQISENNGLYITSFEGTTGRLISFSTLANGAESMRINSSGYVGINSTSPISQLSVKGAGSSTGVTLTLENGGGIAALNDPLGIIDFYSNDPSAGASGVHGSLSVRNEFNGNWDGTPSRQNTYMNFSTAASGVVTEKLRINSTGVVTIGTTNTNPAENNVKGVAWYQDGRQFISSDNNEVMRINRKTSDGVLVFFHQDGTAEGNISVSGTTVSYNGGHLSRYSQTEIYQRIEGLLKGTVMSNLDKMAEWINPKTGEPYTNEQLNCMKISDIEGDINVAGVFVNWDDDDKEFTNDMNIAMTGDMIIRIAQNVVVEKGQLLMSAGDGTAKPQEDDIVRSKTIAKVTSNHITCVYEDGSYCVPCVLMAC